MSTTLSNHRSDHALWVAEMIRKYGHAIMSVDTGSCSVPGCRCEPRPVPWSYTIGLADDGHPELVTFGLDQRASMKVLNWAASRSRCPDCGVDPGTIADRADGVPIRFDAVPVGWITDAAVDPMGRWWAHYAPGRRSLAPPRVVQCVWADADGRFPDDPACDPAVAACQPVGALLLGDWRGNASVPPNRAQRRSRR